MRGALEGVRIVDFTQMMLGPWCTQFLGDMGADVIKVERPGSGEWERGLPAMNQMLAGESPFFLAMNRNKRSLTVNMKSAGGKAVIADLVKDADVVVENFRPGVMDSLGVGYEDLKRIKPSLIYAAGSGYGPDGPYVRRPGQDLLIQAMSGLLAQNGPGDRAPVPVASSIIDASTALMLALAIMVALFHRERTGEGQRVDASLFNTAISLQCQELLAWMNLDVKWKRSEAGIGAPWLAAPFGVYACTDGHIAISINPIRTVGEVLDLPALANWPEQDDPYVRRDDIRREIEARVRTQSCDHWLPLFAERDLWCARVQDFDDVMRDPQVMHNGLLETVTHPKAGDVKVVGIPVRLSETPGGIRLAPPLVGEHTSEILSELGYGAERIEELRQNGSI